MSRPFEQLLELCLQELADLGDVETVLERHPQQAGQLRPLLQLAADTGSQLASVPPPPGGLSPGRTRLLTAASRLRAQLPPVPIQEDINRRREMRLRLLAKFASVTLTVLVFMAALGGGVVWAASGSIPGDALYPLKLGIEDLRLSRAASAQSQVALALQFAEERAAEIEELAELESPAPEQLLARMELHIQHALQQAASAPEGSMAGLLEQVRQSTQTQIQALERVREGASEATQARIQLALQICQRLHEETLAGLSDPQTFRWRHQDRENQPDWAEPPEPPQVEPPAGSGEGQGSGEPNPTPGEAPHDPNQQGGGGSGQGTQEPNQQGGSGGAGQGTQEPNQQGSNGESGQGTQEPNQQGGAGVGGNGGKGESGAPQGTQQHNGAGETPVPSPANGDGGQ
jgi:hypothetical protein